MSILHQGFKALAKGLREFGYPDVTPELIEAAHTEWKQGKPANGIIAMFAEKEFIERPEIFGLPDAEAGRAND